MNTLKSALKEWLLASSKLISTIWRVLLLILSSGVERAKRALTHSSKP